MTHSLPQLLDMMHLRLETERTAPDLTGIEPALLVEAVAAIAEAKAAIVADPSLARIALPQVDALFDMLETIRSFQRQKLLRCDHCPDTALPSEREFHANLVKARAILESSWPSVMNRLR